MKSSFLSILLSVLASISLAQSLEFGINGGLTKYSVHSVYYGSSFININTTQSSVISFPVSASVTYDYKNFRFGMAAEKNSIKYKSLYEPDFSPYIMPPTIQFSVKETPVKIVVSRLIHFSKLTCYVGISGIYKLSQNQTRMLTTSSLWANEFNKTSHGSTIGFAAQIGGTYFVSKHLGLNAELSGLYNNFPAGPLDKNIFSFPASLGFRYKLK